MATERAGRRKRTIGELDLNLLVALDALLRERNVTRAGALVGMSQPTMSTALGKLRRFFDDELLVRVGRDFQLTPAATDLVLPVQEILLRVQQVIDGPAGFDPGAAERTFRVVASDYGQLILQGVVQHLAREAPGIRVRFQIPDERTDRLLQQRRADLVILSRLPGFSSQELFTDRWVCAFDPDHHQLGDSMTKKQFLAATHVAFAVGRFGRSGAEDQLAALGVKRNVAFTTHSFAASLYLVRGTPLVSIVQERLAHLLADVTATRWVPVPFLIDPIVFSQWWHPLDTDDAAHTYLRSVFAMVAADLT